MEPDLAACKAKMTEVFRRMETFEEKRAVPSENLIRWIRSGKENRIMIETDGDLLRTSAWIYAGLLSFA